MHPLIKTSLLILALTASLFGKSLLITRLNAEANHSQPTSTLPPFKKSLRIEGAFVFFGVSVTLLILFPILAANEIQGTIPKELTLLTIAILFFVLFIIMILREYSLLYSLLTPLEFRSTIEAASRLFFRFQIPSLFFGTFTILITAVFTFFSNLVMLGIVALLQSFPLPGNTITLTLGTTLLFSGYAIYEQALWVTFFRSIALPPKNSSASTPTPFVGEIENLPEVTL